MSHRNIPVLTTEQLQNAFERILSSQRRNYLLMYSSWHGGFITDVQHMMVPIDDHMVHRGDGVFEAFKSIDKKLYLLDQHLNRLEKSAAQISLPLPFDKTEIKGIVLQAGRLAQQPNLMFRLFVSRGPGSFSANPYDSVGSQLYIVVSPLTPVPLSWVSEGVRVARSRIDMKPSFWARIKSCNYLPNVLMKKEAVDSGVDFTVNFSPQGFLGEGSTENIMLINREKELVYPTLNEVLAGTTMLRVAEIAQQNLAKLGLRNVREGSVSYDELMESQEVLMVGTTLDVLPVVQFDGRPVGNGQPGSVSQALLSLLKEDFKNGCLIDSP